MKPTTQISQPMFESSLSFAQQMDLEDELRGYRSQFHIPIQKNGEPYIYFCGNSLGLQPKITKEYLNQELEDWANLGVEGHTEARHPWMPYHEFLTDTMAEIMGAKPIEVVCMNSLTTNLHLLMVSFYRPTENKYKIIIESDAFPSDRYAVESQLKFHGHDPSEALLEWRPREGETLLNIEDLESLLEKEGGQTALLLIGGVNYYTGQYLDLQKIAALGHQHDCKVGIDLAHGAGNIKPNLHQSQVDFAAWCTYKYLNSGPGSLGYIFVHEKYAYDKDLPRFSGWWAHNKETRFNMRQDFDVLPGAEGWQLSNPSILSMAAIRASLDIFKEVGMEKLIDKQRKLTTYLEFLIDQAHTESIEIITPNNVEERGCQLSLQVKNADKKLHDALTAKGIITDWREPDVIRIAPTPLYNSFEEVYQFSEILKSLI